VRASLSRPGDDAAHAAEFVQAVGADVRQHLPAPEAERFEQGAGLTFWIVTAGGDRIGYSGLAAYAPGIADGVTVAAGQALGGATRQTRLAWERGGQRVNLFPLLSVTRPSDP
jgi:hypothetical protein